MAALADLPRLAARISAALERAWTAHAISGAVAMAAHGDVRAAQDLDVLVVASALQRPLVFEMVREEGFEGEDRELIASLRERFVAALRSGPVTVQILAPALPYHRTVVERAVRIAHPEGTVPFVSVEDLVVLKMLWHRAKDVPDIHALIATATGFDADYVRQTLASILPENDPRHEEVADSLRRFRRR